MEASLRVKNAFAVQMVGGCADSILTRAQLPYFVAPATMAP